MKSIAQKLSERSMPEPNSGCLLWTARASGEGYGEVFIKGVRRGAHRLAWEMANGRAIPEGMVVCHKCDVPACINPAHLFLGNHADNMRDMFAKGRGRAGFIAGRHRSNLKLTPDAVRGIRASQESLKKTATRFGVSPTMVRMVRSRERWEHVQ